MRDHWQQLLDNLGYKPGDRILDIGGAMDPVPIADVVVDVVNLGKGGKEYVLQDITWQPLPFEDNSFEICVCSQTLEDLTCPTLILHEMQRVARRGVIECPHRGKESLKNYYSNEEREAGVFSLGASHHKWLIEVLNGVMHFTPKVFRLLMKYPIAEWSGPGGATIYWDDKIPFQVNLDVFDHEIMKNYADFQDRYEAGFYE